MTLDEIAQKIYEERYVAPSDPAIANLLRNGMVREIVQRTLELHKASLALTAADMEALQWLRDRCVARFDPEMTNRCLTILDRLLKGSL